MIKTLYGKFTSISETIVDTKDYVTYIKSYFSEKRIDISKTAINAFKSSYYMNYKSLELMPDKKVIENIGPIFDKIYSGYRERQSRSTKKLRLRDIDVRPVLKREKCKSPPFCETQYEVE